MFPHPSFIWIILCLLSVVPPLHGLPRRYFLTKEACSTVRHDGSIWCLSRFRKQSGIWSHEFFKRKGPLWDEFDHLYETLFGTSKGYLKIIEALATKKSGLIRKEIINETRQEDNGLLTEMLKNYRIVNSFTCGHEPESVSKMMDQAQSEYQRWKTTRHNTI